jgi:iron complex outermembrane receptor protein
MSKVERGPSQAERNSPVAKASRARAGRRLLVVGVCGLSGVLATPALAQSNELQEVIVTARKRQESILNVPVVEQALSQQQLERTQTNDLHDIVKLVPGLTMGETAVSTGAQVSLRGVGTSSLSLGVEQSVALIVDGLQISQGIAYRSAMFDTGQVEVLKGPQSLFYGKSSPGGVISIRSADPTSEAEIIARAGYEFEARQKRGELIVSGPVTDTLKLRLSGMYEDQDGYFKNPAVAIPGTGSSTPAHSRMFAGWDYIVRGTALWNPSEKFDARLKFNYARMRTYNSGSLQLTSCPNGVAAVVGIPFLSAAEDCKLDRIQRQVDFDPAAFPGIEFGGVPQMRLEQKLATLELNYHPTPELTATSQTGLFDARDTVLYNTYQTSGAAPFFSFAQHTRRRDFTQEFRLNSDFTSPLNFTLGAFYQDGLFWGLTDVIGNSALGFPGAYLQHGYHDVHILTYSLFGQARWKLTPTLELAAGARWTSEKRTDKPVDLLTGVPVITPIATPRIKSDNVSPELTLTYRPTDTLTLFGSLKKGYKSGSFNMAVPAVPGEDNSFGDERVKGGEVGLKSRLLNRRLAFDLSAYHYKYAGLQVGATEAPAPGALPTERTVNAGAAKVYGVEFEAAYRPEEIEGLTLNLAANWNHGRYTTLTTVPCSAGQTIAQGCNRVINPNTGLFIAQDLSGLPLVRSPDWQVNFGFDYAHPLGDGMTLILSNANQYASKYPTNLSRRADNVQKGYLKADLSLTLQGPNERWEVALIGKNITDKITAGNCTISNFQGEIFGTVEGGTTSGPAGPGATGCFVDRGREIWVRVTFRPLR